MKYSLAQIRLTQGYTAYLRQWGVNNGGYDVTITYNKVEVNKEVDAGFLEMGK